MSDSNVTQSQDHEEEEEEPQSQEDHEEEEEEEPQSQEDHEEEEESHLSLTLLLIKFNIFFIFKLCFYISILMFLFCIFGKSFQ